MAEEINLRMDDSAAESDTRHQSLAERTENGSRIKWCRGSLALVFQACVRSSVGLSHRLQHLCTKWAVSVFPVDGVDGKRFHGVFIVSLKRVFCPPCERPPSCS